MRLRSKIRQLKEQHAQLRELKEAQQVQLASAAASLHLDECSRRQLCEGVDDVAQELADKTCDGGQ